MQHNSSLSSSRRGCRRGRRCEITLTPSGGGKHGGVIVDMVISLAWQHFCVRGHSGEISEKGVVYKLKMLRRETFSLRYCLSIT
jgi:hypothetical protein